MALPKKYAWLEEESGPRILKEFLKIYGTTEAKGTANNPTIMWWAKQIGLEKAYKNDAIAWCGLAMGYVAGQAGWDYAPRGNALWARNWLFWGNEPKVPMLADVLVFKRGSGGHVGLYVAEDKECFHVLGGNTSDRVTIKRIVRNRLLGARRCPWRINQPANVRKIVTSPDGEITSNEE
jgi:uncharacterized protein (TIGR02594 family)